MADLYGRNTRSSSLGSEDTSSILHDLLNNSLTPPPSSDKHSSPPPPTAAAATSSSGSDLFRRFPHFSYSECRFREGNSTAGSTSFNFSDLGLGFIADVEKCNTNDFSSVCGVDSDGITSSLERKSPAENEFGFDLKGIEGSEAMVNPAPPRSSKRSRAAEFHNLSEKRRRSKINEKLKALQNLIPNSNKTDKASMLDEAIEYLKQLQLQVQMLSMRNGLSLQPFCLLGSLHPAQLPQSGIGFDEGNELFDTKGGEDTYSGNQEMSMRAAFDLPNQSAPSNQPNLITPMTNISNAETSFGLEPSPQNHYGSFSHLTSSNVTY